MDPCTLLEEKWVDEFELPAGLTTLVLEARAKDLTALPVPTSDDNAFLLRAQGPHGYVGMVVVNAGQYAQEPWDWTMDEPAPAGLWKFEAFAAFGSYNAFHLWNFEFGLTFAYWGYELPDGYSAFPDSTDSEKSQTLLDNVDLSNAKVPCASTSWIPRTPPESSSLAAQGRSLPRSPAGLLVSPTKTC